MWLEQVRPIIAKMAFAEATIPLNKASHFFDSNQMIWMMWHLAIAEFDA